MRAAGTWRMAGLAAALSIAAAGCQGGKVSDEDIVVMREERVAAALDDPQTVIVDVRRPEAYAEGHLPGAINIYLPDIRARDQRLSGAQRIIVYAGGWSDPLSTAAVKRMMSLGYVNVYEFKGGVEVWQADERQLIESSDPSAVRPETDE